MTAKTRVGTPVPAARTPSAPVSRSVADELYPGLRIHQYELIRELGRGGMGIVYAARDTKLGRRVAVKFLLDRDRDIAERFLTEARATAQCNHDNIVIVHEVDEHSGTPYMVLEFLDGQTLRDVMGPFQASRRLPASRVVEIGLQIVRALARAHERGIVHRDLKPENVFLTSAGQIKVLDFGIAKPLDLVERVPALERATAASVNLTRAGALVGTLPYMSLEQLGVGELGPRADVWALGIILFEMLAGHHPLPAETLAPTSLIAHLAGDEPMPAIATTVLGVPDPLARLVERCLRKDQQERPTAADLVRRFEAMLPGRSARSLGEGENPYVGLTAFQEGDADRFFGRGADVTRMVARIRERALTAVVGPSGVGKSSFVRAGVVPALKASGERWEALTLRPGRHPLAALARTIERLGGTSKIDPGASHEALIERLRAEPGYVGVRLRERAEALGGQLMVFVDQLEELYTLVHDADERRAFTAALAAIADDPSAPLRVIVSMRSDFVDRVAEDARFTEEVSRGLVLLAPPDRGGLREALVQPVELVGYRFESEAMIGEILDVLGSTTGALPLLQFAAARLWDARDPERKLLTVASYQQIGGISGALAVHADSVIGRLDTRAQGLARRVFRLLVTPERTRAIVELADLQQLSADRGELDRVLDQLVGERLLVVQQRGAAAGSVEIVHESLIERWPTLRRWLDDDADDAQVIAQLAAAAKQWQAKGRPNGMLWRGDALDDAQRWYRQRPRELAVRDREFLEAAIGLARRGRTLRRVALIGVFAVLAAGAAGATAAYIKVHAAEQDATAARMNAEAEAVKARRALADREQKEAERRAEEAKRVAAETDAAHAEREVQAKTAQVAQSREQLEAKNAELETALLEAKHAREQAEAASAAAKKSEAQAKAANAELAAKLDAERAHVKKLEEAKKQLSTQLKD